MSDLIMAGDMVGSNSYHALTVEHLKLLLKKAKSRCKRGNRSLDEALIYLSFGSDEITGTVTVTGFGEWHIDIRLKYPEIPEDKKVNFFKSDKGKTK